MLSPTCTKLHARRPAVHLTWLLGMSNQQPKPRSPFLALPEDFLIRPDPEIDVSIRQHGDLVAARVPPTAHLGDDLSDGFVV